MCAKNGGNEPAIRHLCPIYCAATSCQKLRNWWRKLSLYLFLVRQCESSP